MTRFFSLWRCLLTFVVFYLVVGGPWYLLEVNVSPIAGAILGCVLTPIVYWFGTKFSLTSVKLENALAFGLCSILIVVVLDILLWVEPVGWVSKLVNISFNFEQFYLERYSWLLLLVYLQVLVTPLIYVFVTNRKNK